MRYAYEGWNLIAEWDMTVSPPQLVRTHHWGIDLSGTREGAGGVGGLVMTRHHALPGQDGVKATFPAYDGTGNIIAYLDTADGKPVAEFEYGPFGEVLKQTGPLAGELPHRWSSKFTDDETGLSYYGYRYYSPVAGRWMSRDPIGERGGIAMYGMVGNDPQNRFDPNGLFELSLDATSCTATLVVFVRVNFNNYPGAPGFAGAHNWNERRMSNARKRLEAEIEKTFNNNNVTLEPTPATWQCCGSDCGCGGQGWRPRLDIRIISDPAIGPQQSADMTFNITANLGDQELVSDSIPNPSTDPTSIQMNETSVIAMDLVALSKKFEHMGSKRTGGSSSARPPRTRCAAAHEFGHGLGLDHPGKTRAQKLI